jgi:hypothetical protein
MQPVRRVRRDDGSETPLLAWPSVRRRTERTEAGVVGVWREATAAVSPPDRLVHPCVWIELMRRRAISFISGVASDRGMISLLSSEKV